MNRFPSLFSLRDIYSNYTYMWVSDVILVLMELVQSCIARCQQRMASSSMVESMADHSVLLAADSQDIIPCILLLRLESRLVQAHIETTVPCQDSTYMEKPICQCSVRMAYHGLHGVGRNRSGLYVKDHNRYIPSNRPPAAFTDSLAAAGRTDADWPEG